MPLRALIKKHLSELSKYFDTEQIFLHCPEFARLGIAIRLGRSPTACDVTRIFQELFREHAKPACIRSDNGLEFVARHV